MSVSFLASVVLVQLAAVSAYDGQLIGCYSSLPSSFSLKNTYQYQSSQYCANACAGYDFFALSGGNKCFCGSSYPADVSSSGSCDVSCYGYGTENCGGSSAYDILAQMDVDLSSYSADSTSSESATSSSTAQTSGTDQTSSGTGDSSSTVNQTSSNTSSPETTTTDPSSTSPETTSSSSTSPTTTAETTSSTTPETSSSTTSSKATSSPTTTSQRAMTSLLTTVLENSSATVTSIVYVTTSPTASAGTDSTGSSNKSNSVNKGAVIGGAVGGVFGFLIILLAIIFLFRRKIFSKYQYDDASILADDIAYEEALKANNDSNPFSSEDDADAENVMLGRRRLSDGSLAEQNDYGMKVLRVANPDDQL